MDELQLGGAADPARAWIERENPDGSGVFVIPASVESDRVDFSQTDGGGATAGKVPMSQLEEMAANFARWPMPVGVGVDIDPGAPVDPNKPMPGHIKGFRSGPQYGFVSGVKIIGKHLYATVDATRQLFQQFKDGMWRASSMETVKGYKHPTGGKFSTWALRGLLITNSNALDTTYKPELDGAEALSIMLCSIPKPSTPHNQPASPAPIQGGGAMPTVFEALSVKDEPAALARIEALNASAKKAADLERSTAQLTQDLSTANGALATAQQELSTVKGKLQAAEQKTTEAESLAIRVEKRLKEVEDTQAATAKADKVKRIKAAVKHAVETHRLTPAKASVEGTDGKLIPHKDWTDDQALQWLGSDKSWFRNVEALENYSVTAEPVHDGKPIKGGGAGADDTRGGVETPTTALEMKIREVMEAKGIDFNAALASVKRTDPKLYKSGIEARGPAPAGRPDQE